MKNIIKIWMFVAIAGVAFTACTTEEALEIQKPYTYSEQYYKDIREYKKSDHAIAFAYYENWSPVEGVSGYKKPASWGERIKGLPDSIDIVNLWMGVPTADTHPVAYADLLESQEKLGTRFVMHADASNYGHKFTVNGQDYDMAGNSNISDEMMAAYADYIRQQVEEGHLNGVDIDYEGWSANNLTRLVKLLGEHYGPMGENPEMLLMVDYYGTAPSRDVEPYIDYLINQMYPDQTGYNVNALNANYPSWCPSTKYIVCDQFGKGFGPDGGQAFNYNGETMLSVYAYALWNPSAGRKGGFGVYYLGTNYASNSGIPYGEYRKAIQLQNPANL